MDKMHVRDLQDIAYRYLWILRMLGIENRPFPFPRRIEMSRRCVQLLF